jgi:hypothetical protein
MKRYMKIVILFGIVSMFADMTYEGGWKAVSAFIIICSAHVHWFVLQLKLISIQSIIVLMMR